MNVCVGMNVCAETQMGVFWCVCGHGHVFACVPWAYAHVCGHGRVLTCVAMCVCLLVWSWARAHLLCGSAGAFVDQEPER